MTTNPLTVVATTLSRAWRPVTIPVPEIEPDLVHQSAAHRVSESLQYFFLSVEYWLSPGGRLRAWVRLNLLVAVVLALPLALVFPLITRMFSALAVWSDYAVHIAQSTMKTVGYIAAASAIIMLTHALISAYIRSRRRG